MCSCVNSKKKKKTAGRNPHPHEGGGPRGDGSGSHPGTEKDGDRCVRCMHCLEELVKLHVLLRRSPSTWRLIKSVVKVFWYLGTATLVLCLVRLLTSAHASDTWSSMEAQLVIKG